MLVCAKVVVNLIVRDTAVWLLEQALDEHGAENTTDSFVQIRLVEGPVLNKVGDVLEAVPASAHLDIVTSEETLQEELASITGQPDRFTYLFNHTQVVVHGAQLEVFSKTLDATRVTLDVIFETPLLAENFGKHVVV